MKEMNMTRERLMQPQDLLLGAINPTKSLLMVGAGRGFVIEDMLWGRRYVVTAGHCLPFLPPSDPNHLIEERTYEGPAWTDRRRANSVG